jgi:hypothetical protein
MAIVILAGLVTSTALNLLVLTVIGTAVRGASTLRVTSNGWFTEILGSECLGSQRNFVHFLYRTPAFDAFDDFSDF